jgi:hypothetical protein
MSFLSIPPYQEGEKVIQFGSPPIRVSRRVGRDPGETARKKEEKGKNSTLHPD